MPLHRSRTAALLQAAVTVCVAAALTRTGPLRTLEQLSVDWRFVTRGVRPPQERIVIVEIDHETLAELEDPFLFWGKYYARILATLHEFKARAVGFDILQPISLTEYVPPDDDPDQLFAQVLAQAPETVLIYALRELPDGTVKEVVPTEQLNFARELAGGQLGYENMEAEGDEVIRQHPLADGEAKELRQSFPLALATVATGEQPRFRSAAPGIQLGQRFVRTDARWRLPINFRGPNRTFPHGDYSGTHRREEGAGSAALCLARR
jgi:CHASE2 domain-containing sensor protein